MSARTQNLVLYRRMRTPCATSLHCREMELSLAEDGRHLVLNRYTELYGDAGNSWCSVAQHRVGLAAMVRWMLDHGDSVEPAKRHP